VCYSDQTLCRDASIDYLISRGPKQNLQLACPICPITYSSRVDWDGDGHANEASGGDDCDDNDANRFPGNVEVCDLNGHDEDCDASTFAGSDGDSDRDGFISAACRNFDGRGWYTGDDCNDADPYIHPHAGETCDGKDNNCNGDVDENTQAVAYPDNDGDGFGAVGSSGIRMCLPQIFQPASTPPRRFSLYNTDCDDSEPRKNPGAPEVRDNLDNDCNGIVDDVERR
jgi:hypothetical protein